jgi:hypothetical protein
MSTDDPNPQTHLEFTAITDSGRALDISFPLHPHSGSPEAVASMISALLQTLSDQVGEHGEISDGDVLQALGMTMAIRGQLMDQDEESTKQVRQLQHELLDVAQDAVAEARPYVAGRA